ncbi:MAG TPA: PaaI family thioesterase [Streptosporangiaceae bacterium]|nr:PaaI family thioesterase [Streptosporangiaceae bacterium]
MSPDKRDESDEGAAEVSDGGRASRPYSAGGGPVVARADPALLAALASLAAATRELVEAVVLSDAPVAELGAAAAEIGNLAARLGARRRPGPIRSRVGPADARLRLPHSPVTGEANPLAPPIRIATTPGGTARAEFALGPVYQGPPDAVHGGICAAILDSLLGAAAAAGDRPGMTAKLTLLYLRPTPLRAPLVAEAWIRGVDRRTTIVDGRILNERGELTVEATGEFSLPLRSQPHPRRGTGPVGGQPGPRRP